MKLQETISIFVLSSELQVFEVDSNVDSCMIYEWE